MIDVIQQVQAANPGLGSRIVVLRNESRALTADRTLAPEAEAWLAQHAPGARFARESILLAAYPGAAPEPRTVCVLAFVEARELAAFAAAWTGDPPDAASVP